MLPTATNRQQHRLSEISRRIDVTWPILERHSDRQRDSALIEQINLDRSHAYCGIVTEPLIAVKHGQFSARAAAVRSNLNVTITRSGGTACRNVRDWRRADNTAVAPIQRGAILKIIDLADDNRASGPGKDEQCDERKTQGRRVHIGREC